MLQILPGGIKCSCIRNYVIDTGGKHEILGIKNDQNIGISWKNHLSQISQGKANI